MQENVFNLVFTPLLFSQQCILLKSWGNCQPQMVRCFVAFAMKSTVSDQPILNASSEITVLVGDAIIRRKRFRIELIVKWH